MTAAATATVELVPGSANAETSTIVAAPTVLPADGTSTATVTVALLDAQGHPVGVGGQAVTMSTDAGALSVAVDNGDGTWRATFTAPTSVSPTAATIGFTVDGVPGTATTSVSFVPGQPDGSTSLIDATPATVVADGTGTSTVTVTVRDSNGNVVPDAGPVVMITTTLGSASATTDHGDGSYTATVSSVTAGAATVGFTLSGVAQAPTAAVTFAPGPADAGTSMITATPGAIPADGIGTATVTVTLYDANGNRISVGGPVVAMGTTTGTLGTVTDNGDGSHTAVLTAPTASGTATLSFAVDGTPGAATTTVDFVRPTADVGTSEIAASPTAIGSEPGDASAVTVTLRDSNGLALGEGGRHRGDLL
ncbi:Ig-like domain-containing protein [Microbacterium aurugineum]